MNAKQRKFVNAKIKGSSNRKAGLIAGARSPVAADQYAYRMSKDVNVRAAIEHALKAQEVTPEYLVGKLKEVIEQDKEIGAKRLAIKDGLELHGWQRGDRPNISLDIKQAFFNESRGNVLEGESVE